MAESLRNPAAVFVACATALVVAAGCTGQTPSESRPTGATVPDDLTQQQATIRVDDYTNLIASQLPAGSRLVTWKTGTMYCHTDDGDQRTGQVLVTARYVVEGTNPNRYSRMIDDLRDTWTSLGYHLIDDLHYDNNDRTVRVATPADDYHLTMHVYGDNRSTPLVVIESPCAWPNVSS